MNQSEFSRHVGVTRGAIWQAVRAGTVIKDGNSVDPDHPVNVEYLNNAQNRNSGNRAEVSLAKAVIKETQKPGVVSEIMNKMGKLEKLFMENLQAKTTQPQAIQEPIAQDEKPKPEETQAAESKPEKTKPPPKPAKPPPQTRPTSNPKNDLGGYDPEIISEAIAEKKRKAALDNLKLMKEQIKTAELMGDLLFRADVEKFIGVMAGLMSNFFLPMDYRVTPKIMDICKVTDQETRIAISDAIAKETTEGLTQMKRGLTEFAESLASPLS